MNELLQTFGGLHGRPAQIAAWIGAARLPMKIIASWLLPWFHRVITKLEANEDPFIGEMAARVLQNRAYRLFVFLLDTAISIKLPTVETLHVHKIVSAPAAPEPQTQL